MVRLIEFRWFDRLLGWFERATGYGVAVCSECGGWHFESVAILEHGRGQAGRVGVLGER